MALADSLIIKNIERGYIIIDPFNIDNINPCSLDLTLSPICKVYNVRAVNTQDVFKDWDDAKRSEYNIKYKSLDNFVLDTKSHNETFKFNIPESGLTLLPNHLYLMCTNEKIGLKGNICANVDGKSSLGRLGIDIHICAGFLDPGFEGSLVLEVRVIYPTKIYPNMKICQVKFESVEGQILVPYNKKEGSKYMNQTGVQPSLMFKNFV